MQSLLHKNHIIQWSRSQNPPCPWNRSTCENGHLHVLEWLRNQEPPCPWNIRLCQRATKMVISI